MARLAVHLAGEEPRDDLRVQLVVLDQLEQLSTSGSDMVDHVVVEVEVERGPELIAH